MSRKQFFGKSAFRFKRFERKNYSAFNSMHKCVTIGVLSAGILLSTGVKTANAQKDNSDSIMLQKTLEEVEITEKWTEPITAAGKIVTIITQQEIESLHAQSLQEILNATSAIDIQQRGTHGVQADISIRGGGFNETALLLNGINITNPHTGHYSLDIPINTGDIERIEVIKGPTAMIYGVGAFAGAINIITKKGIDKSLNLSLEAGEHGFWNVETSVAKKFGKIENYLGIGAKHSDGYMKNSAYQIYNALYQSRINLDPTNEIDLQLGYNLKDYDANTFYSNKYPHQHDSTASFLASARGIFAINKNFLIIPTAYYNVHIDKYDLIRYVSNPNYHKSNVWGNNLSFSYTPYENKPTRTSFTLNFGSDVRFEEILSSVLGENSMLHGDHYNHYQGRTNFSYFAQGNYNYKKLSLLFGIMSFQNTMIEQDIYNFYPSININYTINNHWALYLNASSSSRLPTFTELYYSDPVHHPNPNLKQEKSKGYEFGIKNFNHITISSLNIYAMWGKDMIDWCKDSPDDTKWESRNINTLNKYGFDIESKVYLSEIFPNIFSNYYLFNGISTFTITYSYLYEEQGGKDYISSYTLNYLRHKLSMILSLPIAKGLNVNISGRIAKRISTIAEEKPFFIMDANVSYNIHNINIYITATNITNEEYHDIGNIIQPKRWIIGGIKYSIPIPKR